MNELLFNGASGKQGNTVISLKKTKPKKTILHLGYSACCRAFDFNSPENGFSLNAP